MSHLRVDTFVRVVRKPKNVAHVSWCCDVTREGLGRPSEVWCILYFVLRGSRCVNRDTLCSDVGGGIVIVVFYNGVQCCICGRGFGTWSSSGQARAIGGLGFE